MYTLVLSKRSQKEIIKIKKDQKLWQKLTEIFRSLEKNPYFNDFKAEKLKYNFQGYFSKKLDKKNQVIYQVVENKVLVMIISVLGHYE